MHVPWIDGIGRAQFRYACGNPSHQWTRTLCRASTITATDRSTNLRPVDHLDRRSRQEYRFLRRVYGRRAMPDPAGRLRRASVDGSTDRLTEATATWSDAKTTSA